MPGLIQSVERAAAILRLLAGAGRALRVGEVAASLDLPKATAHGILRTLEHVGFVEQDRTTGRYALGAELPRPGAGHVDVNELRSHAINWADPLAGRSGEAVRVGTLLDGKVLVVHHVFRPDDTPQVLDTGSLLPPHATALGKVLLAHDPAAAAVVAHHALVPYTRRTTVTAAALHRVLGEARDQGWSAEVEEMTVGQAGIAAPIRVYGGLVVGAIGISGAVDRLCDTQGQARPLLVSLVRSTARAVSRDLGASRW